MKPAPVRERDTIRPYLRDEGGKIVISVLNQDNVKVVEGVYTTA